MKDKNSKGSDTLSAC